MDLSALQIILLSAISLFVAPSLATITGHSSQQSIEHHPPTLSSTSIARWIDLHRKIFDVIQLPQTMSVDQIENSLKEMSTIEEDENFGSHDQAASLHDDRFKTILNKYVETKPVTSRHATITNLLLQTFDYDSNECTEEYFEQLDDIYGDLEGSGVAQAFVHNRDLQWRNCWRRMMNSLATSNMLLGSDVKKPLDELVAMAYPMPAEIVIPSVDSTGAIYTEESNRISGIIAQFLKAQTKQQDELDYKKEFKVSIKQPCEQLISRTKQLMMDIYKLFKIYADKSGVISPSDALIVNRYMMCRRIVADSVSIRSNISQYSNKMNVNEHNHDNLNPPTGLITQHITSGLDPCQSILRDATNAHSDTEDEPSAKRQRLEQQIGAKIYTTPEIGPGLGFGQKSVDKISYSYGRGQHAAYEILWSDGTSSLVSKAHLIANCPEHWDKYYKGRKYKNRLKYYARKTEKASTPRPTEAQFIPLDGPPIVIQIEAATSRGVQTRYPTHWSDGSKTMERREFLETHWNGPWMEQVRRTELERRRRWVENKSKQD